MKKWRTWLKVRLVVVGKIAVFHLDLPDKKRATRYRVAFRSREWGRSLAVVLRFNNSQLDAVNLALSRGHSQLGKTLELFNETGAALADCARKTQPLLNRPLFDRLNCDSVQSATAKRYSR